MSYLLSIVVPTKNRYNNLKHLVELIDSFDSSLLELVIQDNSDDNESFVSWLIAKNYSFVKYDYKTGRIPVSQNADCAINNSSGEFVCFIGDDDGVLPSIIDVIHYMKDNNIESLISSPVTYNWPDFIDNSIYQLSAAVQYKKGSGRYVRINPINEIHNTVKAGLRDLCRLPKVYQGIVKRELLDKIYEKTGSFFPGGSPDMANAIAVALLTPNMVYYDAPLIISGQCKTVGGGERLRNRNDLPLITDVPFLPKNISDTWDDRMPRYWCADTIWPQSAISAYKAMGVELPEINFNHILATFIFDHPSYYKECKSYISNYCSFCYYFAKCFFVKGVRYLYWHISFLVSGKKKRAGVYIQRDLNTINEVVLFLNNVITNTK